MVNEKIDFTKIPVDKLQLRDGSLVLGVHENDAYVKDCLLVVFRNKSNCAVQSVTVWKSGQRNKEYGNDPNDLVLKSQIPIKIVKATYARTKKNGGHTIIVKNTALQANSQRAMDQAAGMKCSLVSLIELEIPQE